ncbi:nitroreductase family protein [Glaciecola petra]|uniref:Nitroreductase family protein n=1 Tax=Glaciecola petra TaxID=3075602 RepID=A0ABU2ZUC6_9ALTE|nr:nitroreductase family protein [Aestuariibacter sp. P117]MDT0596237.1 nitroreductase family protein [Aestuariibacter sp. P117]
MNEEKALPLNDFISYDDNTMLEKSLAFFDHIKRRHSVRKFSDKPVAKSVIENAIKAAGRAPNGANHQPWHFCAISSSEVKKQIRDQAEQHEKRFYDGSAGEEWLDALKPLGTDANKPYLETAPWLIAIFSQKKGGLEESDNKQNYYIHESVGIATGFLITALHTAGLATLTHTPKPMSFLSKICKRPDTERAYMLLVVGHPAEDATIPEHAVKKKSLAQICTFM